MSMTISGSPVDAIMPGAALVTGFEDGRLFLGPRYKGKHVHVAAEHHDEVRSAWLAGGSPHLFARGWKPEDVCDCTDDESVSA